VLFRVLTGGDWHLILWDSVDPTLGGGYVLRIPLECVLRYCSLAPLYSWWGYVYWISFNFIVVIVMLKLFVLVIVDEFLRQEQASAQQHGGNAVRIPGVLGVLRSAGHGLRASRRPACASASSSPAAWIACRQFFPQLLILL